MSTPEVRPAPVSVPQLGRMKAEGRRISMLTCYDATFAFGKADLSAAGKDQLDKNVIAKLGSCASVKLMLITGQEDNYDSQQKLLGSRQALSEASIALQQLATLDAALDQMLSARASRLWLAGPQLMARRFEQLRQGGAEPDTWLDDFGREMQQTQLAELEARLQPVLGLIETFSTEVKRLTQNMRKQSDGAQPATLVHPCLRKS